MALSGLKKIKPVLFGVLALVLLVGCTKDSIDMFSSTSSVTVYVTDCEDIKIKKEIHVK